MKNFFTWFLLITTCFVLPSTAQRAEVDSLKAALKVAPQADEASIIYQLAKKYLRISGDTSKRYAEQAITLAKKQGNDTLLAYCYSILGAREKYIGNFETALTYHLKALDIRIKLNDTAGLAITYNDIGIVYKNMKRWHEALDFYRKANQYALLAGNTTSVSYTYNNLGTVYNEIGQYDSALLSYQNAIYYAKHSGNGNAIATALSNFADIHFTHKRYDSALALFKTCLVYDKANDDKYGISLSHMQIANSYSALGLYNKALAHIDSADEISAKENLHRERIDILMIKSSIQERLQDYTNAIKSIRASTALRDSIINSETSMQVSELQTKYETEKKEQQIELQASELRNKNYIILIISITLLLGVLLGYSYYRRYKLKQQAKLQQAILQQQELATSAVLAAEEKERSRIASDLHDGVGQLMSAARMNLSLVAHEIKFENELQKSAFDKAISLVDDSCKEVRTVSHNIMPNALLKTGLTVAIRDFIQKIDHRALEVNLYTDGMNDRLPVNAETVLYRVIQECINNVIKHSGANKLDLSLIWDEDGLSITIEDNGKGFDASLIYDNNKGIGLKNMQTRVSFLKGTIEWDTKLGHGTVVIINIPQQHLH